jgi:hypothetical protein
MDLEARKELLEASVCFLEAVSVNVEQGPLILTFFLKQYASCVFGLALRTVSLSLLLHHERVILLLCKNSLVTTNICRKDILFPFLGFCSW